MEPVEIELRLKQDVSEESERVVSGMTEIERMAGQVGAAFEHPKNALRKLRVEMDDQQNAVKTLKKEVDSLTEAYNEAAPGKGKLTAAASLREARGVYQEQLAILDEMREKERLLAEASVQLTTRQEILRDSLLRLRMEGKENTEQYAALREEYEEILRAQNAVRNENTATGGALEGIVQGMAGVSGAVSAGAGVMGLLNAASEKYEAIQTRIQSLIAITTGLQQAANAVSARSAFVTNTVAKAKQMWAAAVRILNVQLGISIGLSKAMVATGIGAIIAAVGFLVVKLIQWQKAQEGATAAQAEFTGELNRETEALDDLFDKLKQSREGTKERTDLMDAVNKKYKDYLPNLLTEKSTLEEITKAQKAATSAMAKDLAFKAQEKGIEKLNEKLNRFNEDYQERVNKVIKGLTPEQQGAFSAAAKQMMEEYRKVFKEVGRIDVNELRQELSKKFSEISGGEWMGTWNMDRMPQDIINVFLSEKEVETELDNMKRSMDAYVKGLGLAGSETETVSEEFTTVADRIQKIHTEIDSLNAGLQELRKGDADVNIGEIDAKTAKIRELNDELAKLTGAKPDSPKADKAAKEPAEDLLEAERKNIQQQIALWERYYEYVEAGYADMAGNIYSELAQSASSLESYLEKLERSLRERLTEVGLSEEDRNKLMESYHTVVEVKLKLKPDRTDGEQELDAEAASMNEYLIAYGSYQEKRLAITEKYNQLIAGAKTEGEKKMYAKEQELAGLDVSLAEQSDLWSRLFSDVREMSSKTLKKVIADTKKLLAYLKTPKEQQNEADRPSGFTDEQLEALSQDADKIKAVYDELIEKQDALDERSNYALSDMVKGFGNLKKSSEAAAKALETTDEKQQKLYRDSAEAAKQKGFEQLKTGAMELTGYLSEAVAQMKEFAESTGNTQMGDLADQAGAAMQNLQAAGKGFQQGGWIGAIVGGVTDIISQTVQGAKAVAAFTAQVEKDMRNFHSAVQLLELDRMVGDNESVFGKKNFAEAAEQGRKATEAIRLYNEAVNAEMGTFDGKTEKYRNAGVGWTVPFAAWLGAGEKEVTKAFKSYREAIEKGYTSLEGMQVKTKEYSGWQKFWGKQDEYMSLKDLAPEIFKNGGFDVDVAQAFLDTNTQITEVQREQIQNAIDLKGEYDEACAAIDEQISNTFGFLGNAVTESLVEAIKTGGDAWEIFEKKGMKAFENIGEQLAYEIYIADDLAKLQTDLGNIAKGGGTAEEIAYKQAARLDEWLNELEGDMPGYQDFIKTFLDKYEAWAGDTAEEAGRTGMQGATLARASQESIDELTGGVYAMRMATADIRNYAREQLIVQQSMCSQLDVIAQNSWYLERLDSIQRDMEDIKMRGLKVRV